MSVLSGQTPALKDDIIVTDVDVFFALFNVKGFPYISLMPCPMWHTASAGQAKIINPGTSTNNLIMQEI